jgi:short subunit dehydrogenase-like uncharacterized protein
MATWMIYGANGYTGQLLVEEAVRRGHSPILAGRSAEKLKPVAERFSLEYAAFEVQNALSALRELRPQLVLHAAGPFIHTSRPMLQACLAVGAHYLDLTGEIPVYEQTFAHHEAAQARGVALISGVGFDIVPSDCLIKYVADQVEQPHTVEVAVEALGSSGGSIGVSAGTLKTNLEVIPGGMVVRRNGNLLPIDLGAWTKRFQFPHGERTGIPVSWGDVFTAYYSTGAPNVTAYLALPSWQAKAVQYSGYVIQQLLKVSAIRQWAARQVERHITGPTEQVRATGRTNIYARVSNESGQSAEAWLETIEAYRFTALAGVRVVERVLENDLCGAFTPAQALGADFVLSIDGTTRQDYIPTVK